MAGLSTPGRVTSADPDAGASFMVQSQFALPDGSRRRIIRPQSVVAEGDRRADMGRETDSLGVVEVPAARLWGAQTQRSLEHFSIGKDLIPREMITAYATLKKAAATANHAGKRLDDERYKLIVQTCDEILAGQHHDMFPFHVWMTGSGTHFNMNANQVSPNRDCHTTLT